MSLLKRFSAVLSAVLLATTLQGVVGGVAGATGSFTDYEIANNSSNTGLNQGGNAAAQNVTCTSTTFCWASGQYTDSSNTPNLYVSFFNGSTWTDYPVSKAQSLGTNGIANNVTCTSASFCVVVGQYLDSSGHLQSYASVFDGSTWTDYEIADNSSNTGLNQGNSSAATNISCASDNLCVAAGTYKSNSSSYQSYASVFDGSTWTDYEIADNSSNTGLNQGGNSFPDNVQCPSVTFCYVYGAYTNTSHSVFDYLSTFDGHTWSTIPFSDVSSLGQFASFRYATCYSIDLCVVAGTYNDQFNAAQSYASVFDGSTWTDYEIADNSSNTGLNQGGSSEPMQVVCSAINFCSIDGQYMNQGGVLQSYASVFNGSTWTDYAIANNIGSSGLSQSLVNFVNQLTCTSSTFCYLTGSYIDSQNVAHPYISFFDGSTWTSDDASDIPSLGVNPSVSQAFCTSTSFCFEAGSYFVPSNNSIQSYASVFNGSTWTDYEIADNSSNTGLNRGGQSTTYEVSCTSASFCAIAGGYTDTLGYQQAFITTYQNASNVNVLYRSAGGIGATPASSSVTQGSTITIAASSLVNLGFSFGGWSDGTTVYQPGSSYVVGSSDVIFTADWIPAFGPPTAPTDVVASISNGVATVSFRPGSRGGLPTVDIINLFYNDMPQGHICTTDVIYSCTVAGLDLQSDVTFTVTAENALGSATSIPSNTVTIAQPHTVTTTTVPASPRTPKKMKVISCKKGKLTKKVRGSAPVCPRGWKK